MVSSIVINTLVIALCSYYIRYVSKNSKSKARHWSSIPGFCMGVGIAGTFVSLLITFQTYKEGQILSDLIKEVSFAFIGSLVGLGFSLGMTYTIKSKITEIEEEEQKVAGEENNPYKLLQSIVNNTNQTHIAIDGLKSELVRLLDINNDELKASNKILKDFTDKTEQFNANLFNELIEKLEKAVRDMSNEAITKSLGNLENLNNDLSKNLKTIFSDTGNTITQGQSDLKGSIDSLKSFFEGAIKEMNDAANQSTKVTQESLNQIQNDIVMQMQAIFDKMETAFNEKISEINSATDKIQSEIINMGNNITEKADKIVDEKIQSLEKTFERIEGYQTRSQTVLETTTKSFKETVEKYEQVNEDKTELLGIIGQQLKELEEVRNNGSTLIQNWNDIADTMKAIQDRIKDINNVITQLDNIKTVLANQQN